MQYTTPFEDSTLEQWRTTQSINLEAQYMLSRMVTPHMMRAGYGRIVNISSAQSIASEPNVTVYAASKSGINGLGRQLIDPLI